MSDRAATTQSMGVVNFASGSFTGAGAAETLVLGFKARYVKVFNATDAMLWEKTEGMGATQAIKQVTAGTTTTDTGSAIVIGERSVELSATLAASAKALSWIAFA